MLRKLGVLAVEKVRSLWPEEKFGGIEEAEVPRGGVLPEIAVVGRERLCDAALSRSRTLSAREMMRLAILSNASMSLTKALVALR